MRAMSVVAAALFGWFACAGCAGEIPGDSELAKTSLGNPNKVSPNCTLVVPNDALTAQGLATPYQIKTTNPSQGSCNEGNAADAAFVQATILDPRTHELFVYNPLVVTWGSSPAVAPVVPQLPDGAVVALWFGFNADKLTLAGAQSTTLAQASCVNGLPGDLFGQVSYCNAPAFFSAVNAIGAQNLVPPPPALGTTSDGFMTCPTVRSFFNVDQDPSDNVTSLYLRTAGGQIAQDNAANLAAFPTATVLSNASDNKLLALKLDKVLGCTPYTAPDLSNPLPAGGFGMATSQALNEISAATYQPTATFNGAPSPVALIPSLDPMVLTHGAPDLQKQNLYRAGVDQPAQASAAQAMSDSVSFCKDLLTIQTAGLVHYETLFSGVSTPDPAAANNLFTFMAQRLSTTIGPSPGLGCLSSLGIQNPIQLTFDANGVCTAATVKAVVIQ